MDDLVERLRLLEQDHEPDGWPAVRMRDITALLDALEAVRRAVAIATGERNRVQAKWDKCRINLRAAREDGWQPIETAPHVELAEVLLFNGSEVCAGGWWEGRWTTAHDEIEPQPTHWRPLPEPPAIDQARRKEARNG